MDRTTETARRVRDSGGDDRDRADGRVGRRLVAPPARPAARVRRGSRKSSSTDDVVAGAHCAAATVPAAGVPSTASADAHRLSGHTSWVTNLAISPDGRHAASRSLNQLFRWDLESGDPVGAPTTIREQPLGLAVATGGRTVAIDRTDLLVLEAAAAEPRRLPSLAPRGARHWSLAISSNGQQLAAGGTDGVVRLIDLATGAEIRALRGHSGVVNVAAYSPDDRTLLTGGFDRTVRLWDVATGAQIHQFDGHTSAVHAVTFAPDGRSALSFARTMAGPTTRTVADHFVRMWDLGAGRQRIELPVSAPAVHAATFTPDAASVVALVAQDLIVWDCSTGAQRVHQRILPENATPSSAAFSRDARRLLVGGDGKDRNVLSQIELGDPLARPATPATPATSATPSTRAATPPK